jgi:hypothetical protein
MGQHCPVLNFPAQIKRQVANTEVRVLVGDNDVNFHLEIDFLSTQRRTGSGIAAADDENMVIILTPYCYLSSYLLIVRPG